MSSLRHTLPLILCVGAHVNAQHSSSTCDGRDWIVRSGCDWAYEGYTRDEGMRCGCRMTPTCLGCADGRFANVLSCAECATLNGFWCERESLCMEREATGSSFAIPLKVQCEGQWTRARTKCPSPSPGLPAAPLSPAQKWMYEMANVTGAWAAGATGQGTLIQVNDDGVYGDHPDFAGRFRKDLSCKMSEPADRAYDAHGTTCAAIAAGAADGKCSAGVAYKAELSSCTVLKSAKPGVGDALAAPERDNGEWLKLHLDKVDVSSNSWIPQTCERKALRRGAAALAEPCPFKIPSGYSCSGSGRGYACGEWTTWGKCRESPCCHAACANWGSAATPACQNVINAYCEKFYENNPACEDYLDMALEPCFYNVMNAAEKAALTQAVTKGRGGKGVVVVMAAGNEHQDGEHVGMTAPHNSRMTITVGAVGKDGKHASYSSPGAALFISAPGGDSESVRNHVTASSRPGETCRHAGSGTSFAAPVVSGVAAMILEANPDLHWRDVQGVLQASATTPPGAAMQDGGWSTNSAGVRHHAKYGFGMVNAGRAVEMAKSWASWGPERLATARETTQQAIPDNGADGVTATLNVGEDLVVESVVVYVNMTHPSRGDVEVVLESPGGGRSVLHPGKRPEYTVVETWKLMSVRHWGERSAGEWKLTLRDLVRGERRACADKPYAFVHDSVTFTCRVLSQANICAGGGEGSRFREIGLGLSFKDAMGQFKADGVTPLTQCCACGGGGPAGDVAETLNGWSILVHGRGCADCAPATSTPAPSPSPSSKGSSFSTGAIAGLVAGVVVVIAVIVGVVVWKGKQAAKEAAPGTSTEPVEEAA